jgi:trehalose-6-phosphate synthase
MRPPLIFFQHTPFPTSEIFRALHVRDDLLHVRGIRRYAICLYFKL